MGTTSTEGERIFQAARELLNTVPPDDRLAISAGCCIVLLDAMVRPRRWRVCDFCGQPAAYIASWKTLPVPSPSRLYVCEQHRFQVEDCDRLRELAS